MKTSKKEAIKKENDLIVTGCFTPETSEELETIQVMRETVVATQKGNKHFNANEKTVYFWQVQFSLLKKNLDILSKENKLNIKIVPAKKFKGNLSALKATVFK